MRRLLRRAHRHIFLGDGHDGTSTIPASTAIGKDTLPTVMSVANPTAVRRRHSLNRGFDHPIDWNRLQVPWKMWMPSAMLATTYSAATGMRLRLASTLR